MANVLVVPASGSIIFDSQTAGSSTISPLSTAPRISYDNAGGINIQSYVTATSALDRLTVDGTNGRLFSVSDALTGSIFSVNDISGLPIIEVNSGVADVITMGTYGTNALVVSGGSVAIGTATPGSAKLTVVGNISGNGAIYGPSFTAGPFPTAGILLNYNGSSAGASYIDLFTFGSHSGQSIARFRSSNFSQGNGLLLSKDGFFGWNNQSYAGLADVDTGLVRDTAGVIAQRNGTNPQEFRIYNTYTDAANYERGFFRWDTNTFKIGLSAGGTGVNRNLEFVAGGSTRMAITSAGRVGIGTITPSTNLEITTASNGDGIKLNRSDGERVAWVIDEGAGNGALYLFNGSNSNTGYITGNGISFLNGGNLGIGTTAPNEKLTVSGNISASGNITSNTRYVVSISLSADITANNGTDTPLIFPLIKADPSGWTSVSGSNTRITPTVPGYYNISYMLAWRPGTSGSGNQNNIQIVKNGATVSLAQQPIHVSADVNTTQVATALVYMNGTTDYLTFQAYSSNAAQVIIGDSNWSKVEFFKIN